MPTILAGTLAQVTLNAGETLSIGGAAIVKIRPGMSEVISGTARFGPYSTATTISIQATTDVSYSAKELVPTPAFYALDDSGAYDYKKTYGWQNKDGSDTSVLLLPPSQNASIALICGDSHSDTHQLIVGTYGNELLETGAHAFASGLAGVDVTYYKFALNGITSTDWIANYLNAALAQVVPGVTVAFVRLCTNDVSASVPIATQKANLTTIYKAFAAAGAYVVAVSVPPGVVGFTTLAVPVNNFIQAYFKGSTVGEYCNGFKYIVDGGVAGGPWKANYAVPDNIHFSNLGAQAEARAFTPIYTRLFKPYELISANVNNKAATASSNQILPNPLMIGNNGSGKIPSSAADNDADVSAVYTKGTANSGFGEKQIITVTVGTAAGTKTGRFFTQNVVSLITPGHRFRAAMRLKIVSHTNLKQLRIMLVGSGTISCLATWNGIYAESNQKVYAAGPYDFIVASTQSIVVSATANLQLGIEYGFLTSVAGAAVIEIEQMELIDLDIPVL